jgi:hypothetical protein
MSINEKGPRFFAAVTAVGAGILLLASSACTSKPKPDATSTTTASPATSTNVPSDNHFDGGTYCVQKFLEGPPPTQQLHFSNQVVESDQAKKSQDFQADLSGDNVDLIHRDKWLATDEDRKFFEESKRFDDPKVILRAINNGFAGETVTNHATRSDGVSWRGA